ncbi:MAG: electron transfer flavoprotein subunit beta/FixA family protein [Myxococcota bacterium]|nr:electron transfer flavoprotein subunit beta/FixA family protein [Myxococcota bacterium]
MKILVTVKRVEDPEIKIKIKADGSGLESEQMKYVVNPFDEIAVEEALRLRDTHEGEVVILSLGVADCAQQIRTALAMGADRGVHVLTDETLDPTLASLAMQKVIEDESPDIVLMGKQAVDDDMGQTGVMLAERLGWGQASFASKEASLESEEEKSKQTALNVSDNKVTVVREVDGGIETLCLNLPALITTELRLNIPRYASLPGIMKAKKKEIKEFPLRDLIGDAQPLVEVLKMEKPAARAAGMIVSDVPQLMEKLRNEAKVI